MIKWTCPKCGNSTRTEKETDPHEFCKCGKPYVMEQEEDGE